MNQIALAIILASAIAATTAAAADVRGAASTEDRLKVTLDAVQGAVAYMGAHSEAANLDGGIGIRSVEGQLGSLLARYWTRLPIWAVTRLKSIQVLAAKVAEKTKKAVQRNTPIYYANAGQMIESHYWDTYFPTRQLPMDSIGELLKETDNVVGEDEFDEKFSDDCIREFYGGKGRPQCAISRRCWNAMAMSDGHADYYLTHQVFYLMTGINANCLSNLTAMAKASLPAAVPQERHPVRALLDKLCGRVLVAATLQEKHRFPIPDRDLFMEQVGLCGLSGYTREFAQERWWSHVIGWQRANGCYGSFPGEIIAPVNFDPTRYGNYRRRKRSEAMMSTNGCLSHRTSVAMDALIVFTRLWVEALAARHSEQHWSSV